MEYRYSLNDEDYVFKEFEDLVKEMNANGDFEVGAEFYRAEIKKVLASKLTNADRVIENIEERIFDVLGEYCEEFKFIPGSTAALESLLNEWVNQYTNLQDFFEIGDPVICKITPEEYEEYSDRIQ